MSDLSDLHGVNPISIRWNAESGFLAVAVFNAESGERELQQIELGQAATFVLDLATRERGYGLIKTGTYEMKLTPVGSPPPPWPEDDEYKPALGCWLWNPTYGELRLETNGSIFRQAISGVWDRCLREPQAPEGLQPVIRFVDRVEVPVKAVNKVFEGPIVRIVGWVERDKIPGWTARDSDRPAARCRCRSCPPRRLSLLRRPPPQSQTSQGQEGRGEAQARRSARRC